MQDYETRERMAFNAALASPDKLPLCERKANAADFFRELSTDPEIVAERVEWLLNGSYGYGGREAAREVAENRRMNREAWLVQAVAALDWSCTAADCRKAWHRLYDAQKARLSELVNKAMETALAEA